MLDTTLADKLAGIAVKQIRAGFADKAKRMKEIARNRLAEAGDHEERLDGTFDVVMPVYEGFKQTLTSKLNNPIRINFDRQEEADLKKAKRLTALWERDSKPTRGAWQMKDTIGKSMAFDAGVAIFYCASRGSDGVPYANEFRNVNDSHFYCQPRKGYNLEEHNFLGETHVWKTKSALEKGAESGIYDKEKVASLSSKTSPEDLDANQQLYFADQEQYQMLGADHVDNHDGDPLYCLTNHFMEYEGKRYYLLLDYATGIWVRAEDLDEMFSKPYGYEKALWPYRAWHTHPSITTFWTRAPGDSVWAIHEQIRTILSLAFLNLKKRIKKKRAVDSEMFPDASEIEDSITEVIETNALAQGKSISAGVYEFQTEDNTQIIVNLVGFLNGFLGEQTGITPGSKGSAAEQKATIYIGNLEQVATRMGLYSQFYKQCWAELGLLFFIGAKDHMTEGQYVKILGAVNGSDWHEITNDDVHPLRDFDVVITGGEENAELAQLKNKDRQGALVLAMREYKQLLNPMKTVEEILRSGGWEDQDIREFQDSDVYGDREIISEAAEAIEEIRAGKEPKINRRANTGFVFYLIEWADDHADDITEEQLQLIYAYAFLHLDVAAKNAARRATMLAAMRNAADAMMGAGSPAPTPEKPANPQMPGGPAPMQPGGPAAPGVIP